MSIQLKSGIIPNGESNTIDVDEQDCYVVNSEEEGYAISELKKYLEVEDIVSSHISKEEGECIAVLNIEEPRSEELAQIRWIVERREESKYDGKETIVHNLKEEKVHEINFLAYIDGRPEDAANARLTFDERKNQKVKNNTKTNKQEK